MWLCTQLGFYSIVQKTPQETHIRARAEHDLMNLRRACRADWEIHTSERADYRFRVIIPPAALPSVMEALSASIDYSNFKGIIEHTPDQRDKLAVYYSFHHGMERWQERDNEEASNFSSLETLDYGFEPDNESVQYVPSARDVHLARRRLRYHQLKGNLVQIEDAASVYSELKQARNRAFSRMR